MSYNTNPARVTWTLNGVQHDKVQMLHVGPPHVTCGDDCCCKRPKAAS